VRHKNAGQSIRHRMPGKQKISPRLLAPPYAVSRESAQLPPPTHHPDPGPKRSRPTFCQQHETDLGRAVACLADWPSVIRPRSIRTSILSSKSSTHPPEPVSELTMVRKRKERVACSAQYHEEQERRRESEDDGKPLEKGDEDLRGRRTTPIE
jgi:hypothetical protein